MYHTHSHTHSLGTQTYTQSRVVVALGVVVCGRERRSQGQSLETAAIM